MTKQDRNFQNRFFVRNALRLLPRSLRVFVSTFLFVAGFCYLSLLGSIWFDTEMNVSLVTEGYGDMGNIELVQHSLKYLFWFFGVFAFTVFVFLFTNYSEKVKNFFSLACPLLIIIDISSSWLVRNHSLFSYTMIGSGFLLALSFLIMFCMIQYDMWIRK